MTATMRPMVRKNADGPSWNFSNNYGCEGPSRKRFIREIRKLKWKDAMLLFVFGTGSAYDYGR